MKFKETQKFRQPWIWIIVIIAGLTPVLLFGSGIYHQLIKHQPYGNHPMNDNGLILSFTLVTLLFLLLISLFMALRLLTTIDDKGISYRFFPFHFKYYHINWDEIEKAEVVQYNPIRDYGGWGIRYSRKGKAYNVSGDMGLALTLKNGKHLLIGTQKEQEMKVCLSNFKEITIG